MFIFCAILIFSSCFVSFYIVSFHLEVFMTCTCNYYFYIKSSYFYYFIILFYYTVLNAYGFTILQYLYSILHTIFNLSILFCILLYCLLLSFYDVGSEMRCVMPEGSNPKKPASRNTLLKLGSNISYGNGKKCITIIYLMICLIKIY